MKVALGLLGFFVALLLLYAIQYARYSRGARRLPRQLDKHRRPKKPRWL